MKCFIAKTAGSHKDEMEEIKPKEFIVSINKRIFGFLHWKGDNSWDSLASLKNLQ
jgi:hypothetical protein